MRVVFTNGVFDCFHRGHMNLLRRCVELCEPKGMLVVAVNSDRSVRALKGPDRPHDSWERRAALLQGYCTQALGRFPQVVPFEGDAYPLVAAIRPDVLVKGSDWTHDKIVGATLVESWGGQVVIVPRLLDVSTTKILEAGHA